MSDYVRWIHIATIFDDTTAEQFQNALQNSSLHTSADITADLQHNIWHSSSVLGSLYSGKYTWTVNKCKRFHKYIKHLLNGKLIALELLRIDKVLSEYYKLFGVTPYYNRSGYGRFMQHMVDEELIDDELPIEEELGYNCDALDCGYTDFDTHFPYPICTQSLNNNQKTQYQFYIVQYCYYHGYPPSYTEIRNKVRELATDECDVNNEISRYSSFDLNNLFDDDDGIVLDVPYALFKDYKWSCLILDSKHTIKPPPSRNMKQIVNELVSSISNILDQIYSYLVGNDRNAYYIIMQYNKCKRISIRYLCGDNKRGLMSKISPYDMDKDDCLIIFIIKSK